MCADCVSDTLAKIRGFYADFIKAEEQMKVSKGILEASRQTRQDTKQELTKCQRRALDELEKKVKALTVAQLNEEVRLHNFY